MNSKNRAPSNRLWHSHSPYLLAALISLAALFGIVRLASQDGRDFRELLAAPEKSDKVVLDEAKTLRIRRFCGDCHALPQPDSFPRGAWHEMVSKGYEFYARSGRSDLEPPLFFETLAYFRARAPRQLVFPVPPIVADVPTIPLQTELLRTPGESGAVAPAVSFLRWGRISNDREPVLIMCDMRRGNVTAVDLRSPERTAELLARLENPCHAEVCDLDGDDLLDLVVADLGSYFHADHRLGRVVWLRRNVAGSPCEVMTIASGLGRIADVRPADFDGDGDLDLIVAEFGNDRTGGIHLLRNLRSPEGATRFDREKLDPRPGTIHVPVLDVNGDNRPDFFALISQEQERIDLFVNRGNGQFSRQAIWAAPDLTFASSGIELVDLDQDGDSDIVLTNGDAFDNSYVNPSHGIQWLEQRANLQFVYHRIADLPGAYSARAGDLDLDGDLDLVAATWLPPQIRPENVARETLASLIYLEQMAPGKFVRHTLEVGAPYHAALELADLDGDGDLDIASGRHVLSGRVRNVQSEYDSTSATIWRNRLAR